MGHDRVNRGGGGGAILGGNLRRNEKVSISGFSRNYSAQISTNSREISPPFFSFFSLCAFSRVKIIKMKIRIDICESLFES